MKTLIILLMMMVTTLVATSQDLGDSYKTFTESGTYYTSGTDENNDPYLMYKIDDYNSIKYYFVNDTCNYVMIMTYNKKLAIRLFERYKSVSVDSYIDKNNYKIYILKNGRKFSYNVKTIPSGTKLYTIDIWID